MKLRQKSYLVSVLLVSCVLFLCMLFLTLPNVTTSLKALQSRALGEEKALALAIDGMMEAMPEEDRAQYVRGFSLYDSGGATFALGRGETVWVATEPIPPETEPGKVRRVTQRGRTVLAISDTLSDGIWLHYGLDVTDVVRRTERQAIGSVLICTVLTGGIAAALYGMLRKINRPIDRLAHELRTPLTVIRGYGELLERAKLTPEQQHAAVSYIVTESERLGEISQKLLTMSDAREQAYRPELLSASELSEHLKKTFPTLKTEIGWKSLTGDRALMLSLLSNLIGNAVKASEPDAAVTLRTAPGVIEIIDHGRGMTKEQLAYVNDPAHARNPSVRSGLGVPLCHEIAALHSATLHFVSEEGKGTTASVYFTTL